NAGVEVTKGGGGESCVGGRRTALLLVRLPNADGVAIEEERNGYGGTETEGRDPVDPRGAPRRGGGRWRRACVRGGGGAAEGAGGGGVHHPQGAPAPGRARAGRALRARRGA